MTKLAFILGGGGGSGGLLMEKGRGEGRREGRHLLCVYFDRGEKVV